MSWAENQARIEGKKEIGLCVGLTIHYGKAQRLYAKRGYIPDGCGLSYNERFIVHGESVAADDDLVLALTKIL